MRLALALACLVCLAPGCRQPAQPTAGETADAPLPTARPVADPEAEMLGLWTVDVDRLPEQENFARMPEQQRTLALEMARNLLASMTVRFEPDRYTITTAGKTVGGTWRLVERRGGTLELELAEQPVADEASPGLEKMVIEVDSRGLLMIAAEDEALPLRRKDEAPAARPEGDPAE